MTRTVRRRAAALVVAVAVALLTRCGPALPSTVVPGTAITVAWNGEFTSVNAAAAPTPGNIEVARAIRAGFGDIVDGEFVPDESFGTVAIVDEDPFTVRYDLAEPGWSDGIPLDAADLLLGWAASTGYFAPEADDAGDAEPEAAPTVPTVDEFARSIDVTFAHPTNTWQSAVTVPVAAHIVGKRAFGLDDAMEAKQAVIRAIQDADASALAAIADVWTNDFTIPEGGATIAPDLLVSSGPFRLDDIGVADEGQTVTLVPNPSYRGAVTPQVAQIDLVPAGADPVAAIGGLDVVQVGPTASNAAPIKELERRDHAVQTTHDGTVWTVLLEPTGVLADTAARAAFLRLVPASDLVDRGAGAWSSAYTATTSLLSAPSSRAYEVVSEDSGFAAALGEADDPALEREAAGVAAGSTVCVLYERSSEFAAGAFAALRDAAGAAGWSVTDCGSDDIGLALDGGGWNAAIVRVPIPQTPADVATQWGSDPERDALIAQLAQTVDVYEAREVLAQIEATLVRAAVARPFAANPRVTILDRDVTGVTARNGAHASLTHSVAQWAVVP